ncbi:isoleucine--tRNA ligase [Tessaracoccus sp. ZS01]|uniref:isoleucine--tRNA ligase n=1 Tax=Tessaracoccus sp. ZS01 TaxID=1906324 RepID=UPI00096CFD29|nr:isoleucine--tRNA ligase [Tessaracoccus sp. ZS01]MCG6568773.1 isoleucine--tRNA ligase [Tessaracoccus sp. ZS01]OMG51743.1 isoleucine--tRNA ligase [Tessaracoccus sp. ZS01]
MSTTPGYRAVPAQVDFPALEHDILKLWAERGTFDQSLEKSKGGEPWTFYEGPPTANGMPGTHHIEARVFKDMFPRFKTMRGFHVERKAGWDCHGLPVELAVEKELGFSGKADIEAYGVEAFNARCRESVLRHVDAFSDLTERMGYWVNLDKAYVTMTPEYVESLWWALKQIHSKGLLQEDYRVAPYCPRCGTALSDHELAQGYEDVTDPSIYVRFPLTSGPLAGDVDLLVWTTTPWTLVSNTAVAVHPEVTYRVASHPEQKSLVVAEPLAEQVLGEEWTLGASFTGAEMERWSYQRPLELVEFPAEAHFVVLADYVTTEDGSGLVHQAPAFGEDDMAVCRAYGLPFVNPVTKEGAFEEGLSLVGGMFFKDADAFIVEDLTSRGLMFRKLDYTHSYPHCWRCHTPLLYYAMPSWYIRTTRIKDQLLAENEDTTWHPENIKHGRFGDWLTNNVDWALSRTRYWGTPLPIWRCEDDHQVCVGSRAELSELTDQDQLALDPHRPFVDDITFGCPTCGKESRRVPEVIDAWFDSGSMPFAQWGYPHAEGSVEMFEERYPADFICEAIDQTRGWFYSLMAVGTLVFGESAYQNVVCLGHILADDGRKMSKHLGNVLEPIPLMDKHGADAVRWFMACSGSPWSARRVGDTTIGETVRKVLLTYWNTVAFHTLYARAANWAPKGTAPAVADRHVLDRWLTSTTQELILETTDALENFDTQRYGQALGGFIDALSNWHVRRSRRRFWSGDEGALWTLHETLDTLTRLLAPIMPFVTERVWQDLFYAADPEGPSSVHLASWPVADESLIIPELTEAMRLTQRTVELGRSARAESKMKVRQVLGRMLVPSRIFAKLSPELQDEVKAELNVESIESFDSAGDLVDFSAKGNFRSLGKRFAKKTPLVAKVIAELDAAWLAGQLRDVGHALIEFEGEEVELSADDVIVTERPREGWSVVNEQGETVALDLELTPALVLAGLAREVIRFIQDARKRAGLEITDRIRVTVEADGPLGDAVETHRSLIAGEVLAVELTNAPVAGATDVDDELGLKIALAKA